MDRNAPLPQILTVKSSAGSGKTYRLAQHYIALLILDTLRGGSAKNRISSLVAITFTNKAAQEMRSRIIDWIKRIILDIPLNKSSHTALDDILENEWLARYITASQQSTPENRAFFMEAVRTAIEKDFGELLKNYYSFNVGTVDGFVNLILKASAFKLILPPDFEISLDSSSMIDLVLRECLQRISEDERVRFAFDRFLDNYIETEGSNAGWLPTDLLKDIISSLWSEESKENMDFASDRQPRGAVGDLRSEIERTALQLKEYLASQPDVLPQSNFLKALDSCITVEGNMPGTSTYFGKTLKEGLKKASAPTGPDAEKLWQHLLDLRVPFVESVAATKFASYIEIYDLFKQMLHREVTYRRKLVLIEELNRLLQHVIEEDAFIPEIYYALSQRYTHFLIDEFQDTNHLQWKNIEVLTEEAIARGGTLFLVGDKKQAIYRWRGGRSELVDEIAHRYRGYAVDEQMLGQNYRSAGHIVAFTNEVFDVKQLSKLVDALLPGHPIETLAPLLDSYKDSSQAPLDTRSAEGYVSIEQIMLQDDDDDSVRSAFSKSESIRIVAERFRALISGIRLRNCYRDNEIAVLVRKKEEAQLIVGVLLDMGINVDSELTVNVKNNLLVREMLHFLRFIDAPDDDLAFASFLRGTIFTRKTGLAPTVIDEWLTEERASLDGPPLYLSFRSRHPDIWVGLFEYFFVRSGYLPLYEYVVLFARRWSLFTGFPDEIPYLLHLCEMLKNREGSGENSLSSFLKSFDTVSKGSFGSGTESDKPFLLRTSEAEDAVKVLTVHKAKGLEFPVVILPFLKLNSFGASDGRDKTRYFLTDNDHLKLLFIKKDFRRISPTLEEMYQVREREYLLDELNNIYVALTRAGRELYAFLTHGKGSKTNALIDYFFGLPALRGSVSGNRLVIGEPYGPPLMEPALSGYASGPPKAEPDLDAAVCARRSFGGEEIAWLDKVGGKFTPLRTITRQHLAAKRRGDLIHYVLSLVTALPEEYGAYLNRCIRAGMAKYPFVCPVEELERIFAVFFNNGAFSGFFQPGKDDIVFTEKEILDERGNAFKIDRMIIHPDSIDIVDFKSGEEHVREHREQITRYSELVTGIYPTRRVDAHLLYIEEGRAVTL